MSKGISKKALLKHLAQSEKEDIIREVITLFDKFKNVKEFYAAELTDDANPMLERYKKKITLAYSSSNPKERRTNMNVNRLIKEFKKISINQQETADLMLHRVECGAAAFKRNSNRTSTFYNCIVNTFEEAIKIISSENYTDEFRGRINKIIKASQTEKYGIAERIKSIQKQY